MTPPEWVPQALSVARRSRALDDALGAVAITMVGRMKGDVSAISHGLSIHGRALVSLQKALWDPRTSTSDETLAACQALKYFEVTTASLTDADVKLIDGSFSSQHQIRLMASLGIPRGWLLCLKPVVQNVTLPLLVKPLPRRFGSQQ